MISIEAIYIIALIGIFGVLTPIAITIYIKHRVNKKSSFLALFYQKNSNLLPDDPEPDFDQKIIEHLSLSTTLIETAFEENKISQSIAKTILVSIKEGDVCSAITFVSEEIAKLQESGENPSSQSVQTLEFLLAHIQLLAFAYQDAMNTISNLLKKNKSNLYHLDFFLRLLIELERYDEALKICQRILIIFSKIDDESVKVILKPIIERTYNHIDNRYIIVGSFNNGDRKSVV